MVGQTAAQGTQEALLLDARGQSNAAFSLEAVDFALVLGTARVSASGGAQRLVGDGNVQTFLLGNQNDTISAGGGHDRIQAGGGTNQIDGGAGIDTARYATSAVNAVVKVNSDGSVSVTTAQATDTLRNVEVLRFDDGIRLLSTATQTSQGVTIQEDFYLAQNLDVAAAVKAGVFQSGAEHFAKFGRAEGRDASAVFDTAWYLSQNADVATAVRAGSITAYDHFVTFGWKEGRNPSVWFDTKAYLAANIDAAASGLNPLTYFLTHADGRTAAAADTGLWG
ncbi:hypothetical protein [Elstera litoralis]|uniref:hypothetical protein n=1 Tax=Elstera litoralis TaxID=552518 RepID=UPI0006990A81|nr:hypothetical protein [Elstera litoralis]